MHGLRELQRRFAATLVDGDRNAILAGIRPGAFDPAQRTQIYRNNVYTNLTDALRAIYPVIERLVGDDFFEYVCREFITRHPSRSGNLHTFGGDLAAYLAAFEPARALAYLPDVARLEWCYHEVYHEAEAEGFEIDALAAVDAKDYANLRFRLHPARRLLRSRFPVLDIWRVNLPDHDGDPHVDLDAGGGCLLMLRSGEEVAIHEIGDAEHEMLHGLSRRRALGDCVDSVLKTHPNFDLQAFLAKHIQSRTLAGFSVASNAAGA